MKNIFTDTLTKADVAFIEFGRMPLRDSWWDEGPKETAVIDTPAKDIGVWLIGWWLPVFFAFLYAYWACNGNLAALWYGWAMV